MLAKWDCGLGSYLLKEAFLLLYHIARNKDPFVKSICVSKMGLHVLFIRLIQDWDFKSLDSFFALLYSTKVGRNEEDKVVPLATQSGSIEVKSYYKILTGSSSNFFPWTSIWMLKAPSKVFLHLDSC